MSQTSQRRRATGWAVAGLVLVFGGPAVCLLLIDVPLMLSTGAPAFALMSAGVAAGLVAAARDRRAWVRLACGLDIVLLVLALVAFFGLAALPEATAITEVDIAPDFTLPDHTGQDVALSEMWAQGPVLLVFYRGHW